MASSWPCSTMLSTTRSLISTYWPDWIFSTSLAGNGATAEDSLSALGEEPPAEPSTVAIALVAIIDGKVDSRPPLTTLVLVIGTDRLRDVAGMHATDVIAEGGGIRPRPAGGKECKHKGVNSPHYCLCWQRTCDPRGCKN